MLSTPKNTATLLPYLQVPQGEECLCLSLFTSGDSGRETSYPFEVIDDSPAYYRLIAGCFVTDAGVRLKKVFLQVQKDRYPQPDPFRLTTNRDIDASWQKLCASKQGEGVLLGSQKDAQGMLQRQSSLLYCRERDRFFHPVCPSCALPLTLCCDDSYLDSAGLSPYSTTSQRYLYCASCCDMGLDEIYTYERGHVDPFSVKDRWALLERLGQIGELTPPPDLFPCARCPEHPECYGPDLTVRSRVVPFSFFPFYLMAWDAPTLHSLDFLPLLAGATVEEVKTRLDPRLDAARINLLKTLPWGKGGATFFFAQDERIFLEVLYLKLSFLHRMLKGFFLCKEHEVRFPLNSVWITLPQSDGELPTFWNFCTSLVSDLRSEAAGLSRRRFSSEDLSHLGLAWFQTLLLNSRLQAKDLLFAVTDYLALRRGEKAPARAGIGLPELAVPENLFWHPGEVPVRAEWQRFWERGCAPGFLFLDEADSEANSNFAGRVLEALDMLLAEVKNALFSFPPPLEMQYPAPEADTLLFQGGVTRLMERCRKEFKGSSVPPLPGGDADEAETVIISPRGTPLAPGAVPDPSLETVLISAPSGPAGRPNHVDDTVSETVVLAPEAQKTVTPPMAPPEDEALTETVLLKACRSQNQPQTAVKGAGNGTKQTGNRADGDDQLGETVVLMVPPVPRRPGGFNR